MKKPSVKLKGRTICLRGIYVWKRNGVCLYVGMSDLVFSRLCSHPIHDDDDIEIYSCTGMKRNEILELEASLIQELKPIRNKQHNMRPKNDSMKNDIKITKVLHPKRKRMKKISDEKKEELLSQYPWLTNRRYKTNV